MFERSGRISKHYTYMHSENSIRTSHPIYAFLFAFVIKMVNVISINSNVQKVHTSMYTFTAYSN